MVALLIFGMAVKHCNALPYIAAHCITVHHTGRGYRPVANAPAASMGPLMKPFSPLMMHLHQRSGVAVCCSVLQCVAVYCSELQCVSLCCSVLQSTLIVYLHQRNIFQTATHSKLWASGALSRGASRCNTLQHTTTHAATNPRSPAYSLLSATHIDTQQKTHAHCHSAHTPHTRTHTNTSTQRPREPLWSPSPPTHTHKTPELRVWRSRERKLNRM